MFKCIDFGCGFLLILFGIIAAIIIIEILAKAGF